MRTNITLPPVPLVEGLKACRASAASEEDFQSCVMEKALPTEYRIIQSCVSQTEDPVEAYICSTGKDELRADYRKLKEIGRCMEGGAANEGALAMCLATPFLGQNERNFAACAMQNGGPNGPSWASAAVCALGKDLNPEMQIAAQCAAKTGGQPKAFAICTGGRLAARELEKCWKYGVATDQGCMGPNNEYRKYAEQMKAQAVNIFGANSPITKAYAYWSDNILVPGSGHEAVKLVNYGINDLKNGPGPNNEFMKFGNNIGSTLNQGVDKGKAAINSVTSVVGVKF